MVVSDVDDISAPAAAGDITVNGEQGWIPTGSIPLLAPKRGPWEAPSRQTALERSDGGTTKPAVEWIPQYLVRAYVQSAQPVVIRSCMFLRSS
jgi:hypothetical protein